MADSLDLRLRVRVNADGSAQVLGGVGRDVRTIGQEANTAANQLNRLDQAGRASGVDVSLGAQGASASITELAAAADTAAINMTTAANAAASALADMGAASSVLSSIAASITTIDAALVTMTSSATAANAELFAMSASAPAIESLSVSATTLDAALIALASSATDATIGLMALNSLSATSASVNTLAAAVNLLNAHLVLVTASATSALSTIDSLALSSASASINLGSASSSASATATALAEITAAAASLTVLSTAASALDAALLTASTSATAFNLAVNAVSVSATALDAVIVTSSASIATLATAVGGLTSTVGVLDASLATSATTASTLSATLTTLTTSASTLDTAVLASASALSSLQVVLSGLTASIGILDTAFVTTAASVTALRTTLNTLTTTAGALDAALAASATSAAAFSGAFSTLIASATALDGAFATLTASATTATTALNRLSTTAGGSVAANTHAATMGVYGMVTALASLISSLLAVKEIASFETKMNEVEALTFANAEGMDALAKAARVMGATTAFSAQQAAAGEAELASAGLRVNEILYATPKVLNLASAGSLELAKAAEIAMGTIKGLGLQLSDLPRVNDVLAKTAADSQTNIAQLGDALQQVAPIARLSNISLEQLSAALGILANNNIKGATAGDQFKSMLAALTNETKPTVEMLSRYGLTMRDVDIASRGLPSVLATLQRANLSVADAFQLFGTEAAAAGTILSSSKSELDTFVVGLTAAEGAADQAAQILNKGLAKSFDALLGVLSEAALQLGDTGLKASLTELIVTTTGVISVWEGMGAQFAASNQLTATEAQQLTHLASSINETARAATGLALGIGTVIGAMKAFDIAMAVSARMAAINPFTGLMVSIGALIGLIATAKSDLLSLTNAQSQLAKIDADIAHQSEKLTVLRNEGFIGRAVDIIAGNSIADTTEQLAKLNDERKRVVSALDAEKAANESAAKAAAEKAISDAKVAAGSIKMGTAINSATDSTRKAASTAKEKGDTVAQAVAQEMKALDEQHAKLSLSERDYYQASLAAKHFSEEAIKAALVKWDRNKSLEDDKQANDLLTERLTTLADERTQLMLNEAEWERYRDHILNAQAANGNPDIEKQLNLVSDDNYQKKLDKIKFDADRQALTDYTKSIQSASDSMQRFGDVSNAAFDSALGGFSALSDAFDRMTTGLAANSTALEELAKMQQLNASLPANTADEIKAQRDNALAYEREAIALNQQRTQLELTSARQIAGATAKLFDDKSSAAKAFHNIETALAVASMATKAQEMAVSVTATGVKLAEGAATMFAESGWLGFAGVAAMIAVMAALGYAAAGGGLSGSTSAPELSPDTGTVLGDKAAQSESIDNTYQLLKDIHASEYAELRGINEGVAQLNSGITNVITRIFQAGGIDAAGITLDPTALSAVASTMMTIILPGAELIKQIPVIGDILGGIDDFIFGGLFGETKQSVDATGILTSPTTIGSIVSGGDLAAMQFATIKSTTESWFSETNRYTELLLTLDGDVQSALTSIFRGMGDSMLGLATTFGTDLTDAVNSYVIPAIRVDLKDLSSEDAVKKLNAVISTQLDEMSSAIFGKLIGQYQQLGEGLFETAVRLASEVAVVRDSLQVSGLSLRDNAIAISDALVQAAGGLQEYQTQFSSYYDKFVSESEQQIYLHTKLADALRSSLLVLPKTRDGYRDLIASLDLSNSKDRERYSLLLSLSDAADQYYQALDKQLTTLTNVVDSAKKDLASAYKSEADAISSTITKLDEFKKSMLAFRDSLKTSELADASPFDKYKAARQQYNQVVATIEQGPGSTEASKTAYNEALNSYQAKAQNFLTLSRAYYASSAGYKQDYQAVLSTTDANIASIATAKSEAEQQLDALKASVEQLIDINTSVLSVADAIKNVESAVKALDSYNAENDQRFATDTSAVQAETIKQQQQTTVSEQTAALKTAYSANALNLADTTVAFSEARRAAGAVSLNPDFVNAGGQAWLKSVMGIYGSFDEKLSAEDWAARAEIVDAYLADLKQQYGGHPDLHPFSYYYDAARAIDGSHASGLSYVPYDGYLAELHQGERVLTADESASYQQSQQFMAWYRSLLSAGAVDGSHASGLSYVPYDGYRAELHKGERVLTAEENNHYNSNVSFAPLPPFMINAPAPAQTADDKALRDQLDALLIELKALRELADAGNQHAAANVVTDQAGFKQLIAKTEQQINALEKSTRRARILEHG